MVTTVIETFLPTTGLRVAPIKASVCGITSVPDVGTTEEGTLYHQLWQGLNFIEEAKGMSYGFVAPDALPYTIWSKYVDRAGNEGAWVATPVQAANAATLIRYLAVGSGSDLADGTSPANAWNSWAHAFTQISSLHAAGTLSLLRVKRGSTSTEGVLWNQSSFNGILQIEPYDVGANPEINYVSGTTVFVDNSLNGGLKLIGVDFSGDHVSGSGIGSGQPVARFAQSGGSGYRVMLYQCGFYNSPASATVIDSSAPISEQSSGTFDDYCVAECIFDNTSSAAIGGGGMRGMVFRDNQFLTSTGNDTGSMIRVNRTYGAFVAFNEFDRTGSLFRANNLRINGGGNTVSVDTNIAFTTYKNVFIEADSGIQVDDPNGSSTGYHHSIEVISNKISLRTGASGYCLSVNANGASFSQDIGFLKSETNEYCQGGTNPCMNIAMNGNVTTGKLHRFSTEKDSCLSLTGTGVFSRSVIILRTQGNAANFDDDCLRMINPYGYSAETDNGSDPQCAYDLVDPANKVGMEIGTVVAKFGSVLTFHQGDTLETWIATTGFGTNSTLTEIALDHNMMSIAPATLDLRPGSTSGLQVDIYKGVELRCWLDINLALLSTVSEAGCGEAGTLSFPSGPPVGGGSRYFLIS